MEISFALWYLFPLSVLIATIAMSTGIGGAVFFSPLFMLLLKLEPSVAIGAALATELFGFSSGIVAYLRRKLIDFKLGWNLLMFSVPAAMVGTYYADALPAAVLKAIFATGLLFIGYQLFASWRQEEREKADRSVKEDFVASYESTLTDADGNQYRYTICNKAMGRFFAAIGGAFVGMISVGLAELQDYHLIARCRVPSAVAVATSIFIVVVTVLVASIGHFYHFIFESGPEVLGQVVGIVIFTIPGVVIGGQIGPALQAKLNPDLMKVAVSVLFVAIGLFMLVTLIQ